MTPFSFWPWYTKLLGICYLSWFTISCVYGAYLTREHWLFPILHLLRLR